MTDSAVQLRNIDFSYDGSDFFRDFSIDIPDSRVSVFLGPSGCGKTTLLNLINGLLIPQAGQINRGQGADSNPNISVLFQEPRLLPWRSIRRNIEIILQKHMGRELSRHTAEKYLKLVELKDYMDYYPAGLSGGMRQRAAIARAFAYPASMILMDEPFQALDLGLKMSLTSLFSRLWIEDRRTAIFVTHDISEAILLGDEIFVLSSERPVVIREHISNNEPHAQRSLDSENSIRIEKQLFKLLS